MEVLDRRSDGTYSWMDNPFEISELKAAIDSFCRNSAPGLDRVDYAIIRSFPPSIRLVLLTIFNEMFEQGLFPHAWRTSLVAFVLKSSRDSVP